MDTWMNEQISLNQNILICKVSKKHAYPLAKSMYMEPDKGYIFTFIGNIFHQKKLTEHQWILLLLSEKNE